MLIDRRSDVWSRVVMLSTQFRPVVSPSSKLKAESTSTHPFATDCSYTIAPDVLRDFTKGANAKRFLKGSRVNRGCVRHRLTHWLQGSLHDAVKLLLALQSALDSA